MFKSINDRELMIGVSRDKVFGPVISFGLGGAFFEIMTDRVLALPPLNQFIAKQLIERARISKILGEFSQNASCKFRYYHQYVAAYF